MATAYLVASGSYSDYHPIHVFTKRKKAERFTRDYNAEVRWSHEDDKARVEEIDLD